MALELRRIILSRDEFASALASYRRANQGAFPSGAIVDCEVNRDATGRVSIKLDQEGGEITREITVASAMLTDVLIRFCLENNISLPRAGKKYVASHAGRAALEVQFGDIGIEIREIESPDEPEADAVSTRTAS